MSINYIKLLEYFIERDECKIDVILYENIKRGSKIKYICKCGNENEKTVYRIKTHGAFCKKCIQLIYIEKMKKTNMIKYGVENTSQSLEIKEKKKQTSFKNYGVDNPSQSLEIKEKMKKTNIEKYGVEYPMQNMDVLQKVKQSNIEKYGVEYPMQNMDVLQKAKQTNLKKYGVENPSQIIEIKQKKIETTLKNYGVENHFQSNEMKEKIKLTNLEKYGVNYPIQNSEIADKQFKKLNKLKKFVYPSGKIINLQGYEPFALEILINQGYKENDIITCKKEIPVIWYNHSNKKHRYYCDIYIISENKIIEVKSDYTFKSNKKINILKGYSCINLGYNFEFWVFSKNKKLEILNISEASILF